MTNSIRSYHRLNTVVSHRNFLFFFLMLGISFTVLLNFQDSYSQSTTSSSDNAANSSKLVDFASNMNQIQGHFNASLMNKQAGNDSLAVVHAGHPIDEVYSLVEQQIANTNSTLNQTLLTSLIQLRDLAGSSTAEQYNTELLQRANLVNQAYEQVIPEEIRNNLTFNLMVIADLLDIAGHEYEEAVSNNTIIEMMEYQDGQNFIKQAESLLKSSQPAAIGDNTSEIQDLSPMFTELDQHIQDIANPDEVSTSISQIVQRISTFTGEVGEGDSAGTDDKDNPIQMISNVRNLISQSLDEYNNQNYIEAEALATEAYLDNYEYVEIPLAEKDRTLMETTEVMLREDLRKMIIDRAPSEEIESHIQDINSNLDQAEDLLTNQ